MYCRYTLYRSSYVSAPENTNMNIHKRIFCDSLKQPNALVRIVGRSRTTKRNRHNREFYYRHLTMQ